MKKAQEEFRCTFKEALRSMRAKGLSIKLFQTGSSAGRLLWNRRGKDIELPSDTKARVDYIEARKSPRHKHCCAEWIRERGVNRWRAIGLLYYYYEGSGSL
jgi:hypothetical protein